MIGEASGLDMKCNRVAGILVRLVPFVLSLVAAGIVCTYLTEYGAGRILLAAAIVTVGSGVSVVAYLLVSGHCKSNRCATVVVALLHGIIFASESYRESL
jgi:hypothetical protein